MEKKTCKLPVGSGKFQCVVSSQWAIVEDEERIWIPEAQYCSANATVKIIAGKSDATREVGAIIVEIHFDQGFSENWELLIA